MKKFLLKAFIISILFFICVSYTSYASTSDVFDETYYNTFGKAYGSGLMAPNVAEDNDMVDVGRGEVVV